MQIRKYANAFEARFYINVRTTLWAGSAKSEQLIASGANNGYD